MNNYFLLNNDEFSLNSSLDIFNFPPNKSFCKDKIKDIYLYAFYSDGKKWIHKQITKINKNDYFLLKKSDLPNNFQDKSVFISFTFRPNEFYLSLQNFNYMNSTPQWRANTKLFNDNCSTSYQSEYPSSILDKKISLVSCSPMIQKKYNNYFYLINLTNEPKKKEFLIEVMNTKKEIIYKEIFYTNTINHFNLKKTKFEFLEQFYIFKSTNFGGVPLYLSISDDACAMSMEHTHPPNEYIFLGDRNFFQKKKKNFWFSKK